MANKKVLTGVAIASLAIIGVGVGCGVTLADTLNPVNANNHVVHWTSAPTYEDGKLFLSGDEGGKIEVDATNSDLDATSGVVTLNANGTFENVSAIGSIVEVNLTYTVGDDTTEYDGDVKGQVLNLEYGYTISEDDPTVVYSAPTKFSNNWKWNKMLEPSYLRFTSTTTEKINITKIDLTYVCSEHRHAHALAEPGLYVVGKGSFVKNNAAWSAYGGTKMTWTGKQNEVVMDFKAGDIFSFQNEKGVWETWNYSSAASDAYKHNDNGHNVEILKDCKLGIYLSDGNLYLAVK